MDVEVSVTCLFYDIFEYKKMYMEYPSRTGETFFKSHGKCILSEGKSGKNFSLYLM